MSKPDQSNESVRPVFFVAAGRTHAAIQQDRNTVRVEEFISLAAVGQVTVDGQPRIVNDYIRRPERTPHGTLWVTVVTLQEQ